MSVKFKKEFLLDVVDVLWDPIEDNIIDTSRWSEIHEIIFNHDGKFYRTQYSCGATESQDESPWEYENEVECTEVHKVEKLMEVWEPVEA